MSPVQQAYWRDVATQALTLEQSAKVLHAAVLQEFPTGRVLYTATVSGWTCHLEMHGPHQRTTHLGGDDAWWGGALGTAVLRWLDTLPPSDPAAPPLST